MKKVLAISLFPLFLFGFADSTLAVVCDSCDCANNVICPGCANTSLRCIGDSLPGDAKKEGVCQDPNRIVFCSPITHKTFGDLIDAIINFIFTIAMVVVPLLIIIGAFNIMTAGGDAKKVAAGKTIITSALIGLTVILLAKGIIAMLEQAIGIKIGG